MINYVLAPETFPLEGQHISHDKCIVMLKDYTALKRLCTLPPVFLIKLPFKTSLHLAVL